MLSIILSILKIFGIIILSLLGLLILIIIVVLFVPVRYRAKGSYKDNIFKIKATVSYLLHFFTAIILYDSKLDYYIRLFGIKINLKDRKKKVSKDISNQKSESNKESTDISIDESKDDSSNQEFTDEVNPKPSFKERKADIDFYLELLQKDETKAAILTCKDRIGKMIKTLLPYKGKIYVAFGSGDAGLVGEIFGFYEALFPYIGNVITFVPHFTDKYIEVSFDIKGRIRAINVLYQLIRIYFDKNCHRLIRIFIKKNRRK